MHCTVPVTFPQATLGSEMEVPTLSGKVKVKIPAGTEDGRVLRLRGHGVPDIRANGTGELYVHIHISVPKKLSKDQEDLLRAFATATGDDVYPERSSFLNIAKRFWDDLAGESK